MAATMEITCPECKRQINGPADLLGKKIRCKACGEVFVVERAKTSAPKAPPPSKPAKPAKPAKNEKQSSMAFGDDEDDDGNPYAVTHLDLSQRCPHCANEMDEGDTVCLTCGYNTQTRQRFETRKVIGFTGLEIFLWLFPPILCVILVLALIGGDIFVWIKFPDYYEENKEAWWVGVTFGKFAEIYSTLIGVAICWFAGKFAFKRLILHPKPPEKIKG